MSDHLGGGYANKLIIPVEGTIKHNHYPIGDEISDLRKFGIDNCNKSSIDVSEIRWGHLSLDERFSK